MPPKLVFSESTNVLISVSISAFTAWRSESDIVPVEADWISVVIRLSELVAFSNAESCMLVQSVVSAIVTENSSFWIKLLFKFMICDARSGSSDGLLISFIEDNWLLYFSNLPWLRLMLWIMFVEVILSVIRMLYTPVRLIKVSSISEVTANTLAFA